MAMQMQRCSTFRWDISRKEQLNRSVEAAERWPFGSFVEELRDCCARVLSQSQDGDLIFVGRSPESLFDYLTGALEQTPWGERSRLLNVSLRCCQDTYPSLRRRDPDALARLCRQFDRVGVSPSQILKAPRPVVFVDLVHEGWTFGYLTELLLGWARAEGLDTDEVKAQMRFVGIVERGKSSPKAWRWWQQQAWTHQFPPGAIKNVSVSPRFWRYLGNSQTKVCETNPAMTWSKGEPTKKHYCNELNEALALARALYEVGASREERHALSARLASQRGVRHRWCRSLISALRGRSAR